ncbi:hypothetical protein [Hyphomonas chukchiensis]|uniref:Uncharacterized protein n=3 Tax=Hyphomonadaceae TaxID=69657 RepID=A0A062UA90_9PROT|nr:hypothetical protein [Hyphomonas chukchiensis]KCZ55192.1 hypothetical protein HY30_08490 [Hyphomonas chukchiensis]
MEMTTPACIYMMIMIRARLSVFRAFCARFDALVIQSLTDYRLRINRMYIRRRRANQHGRDQTSREPKSDIEDDAEQTHVMRHNSQFFKNH